MAFSWFVQRNGNEEGPLPTARIAEMARDGSVLPHDYVRRSDMEKWVPAGKVKGLQFRSATSTVALPAPEAQIIDRIRTSDGREIELLSNETWRCRTEESSVVQAMSQPHPANVSTFRGFQFRKTRWGMSEREVRDSETSDPAFESTDALGFQSIVAGLSCETFYIFIDNQLVRGKYVFNERHSNNNHYISDYVTLKELLTEKYGLPLSRDNRQRDQIWLNDLYQDDSDDWGTAVAAGHLVYLTEWQQEETKIGLILRGDNYDISLAIEYASKEHEGLEEQSRQQKHLEDL